MNHLTSSAALTCAAFLFASQATAVETPVRLYEISVNRFFADDDDGERWTERGLLNALGQFRRTSIAPTLSTVTVPAEVLDRWVITIDAWNAYGNLGPEAVADFEIDEVNFHTIGEREYRTVSTRDDAKLDVGHVVNISTRATVMPGGSPMIGGFVIEGQHRRVLIRGVGPALAGLGVSDALENPHIVLYPAGSTQFLLFNDDWEQRFDAAEIEVVAAQVGAFPLAHGSKDAALLYELEPGGYTVHLSAESGASGTALLEVFTVP